MYVTSINIPFAFEANSDDEARAIARKIAEIVDRREFKLGMLRTRHGAEQTDGAQAIEISEVLRYEPQREVALYPTTIEG